MKKLTLEIFKTAGEQAALSAEGWESNTSNKCSETFKCPQTGFQ